MGILCDAEIKTFALEQGMIEPFMDHLVNQDGQRRVLSYGLSSYGYDIRLSPKQCLIFGRIQEGVSDPKDFNPQILSES